MNRKSRGTFFSRDAKFIPTEVLEITIEKKTTDTHFSTRPYENLYLAVPPTPTPPNYLSHAYVFQSPNISFPFCLSSMNIEKLYSLA